MKNKFYLGKLIEEQTQLVEINTTNYPMYVSEKVLNTEIYEDISSIENWNSYGYNTGKDYKFVRRQIQILYEENNWSDFNEHEKYVISSYLIPELEVSRVILGLRLNYYASQFDLNSYESRRRRFSFAKAILLNNISRLDGFQILEVLNSDNLTKDYLEQGLEGTFDDDPIEGLFNFVESTSLSLYGGLTTDFFGNNLGKYENNGIRTRNLTFLPNAHIVDNQTLVEAIMACLRDGDY
jgi:hypothetical protein